MSARGAQARWFIKEADPPSKQSILRAALKLFVKHGLAGTNVRMIGAEAGYTNPAMFKFFASKHALALYLFESCYGRLYGLVESAAARGSFHEGLGGVLDVLLAQIGRPAGAARAHALLRRGRGARAPAQSGAAPGADEDAGGLTRWAPAGPPAGSSRQSS